MTDYKKDFPLLAGSDIAYLDNTGLVKDEYYAEDGYHFKSDFYPYWLNSMAQGAGL